MLFVELFEQIYLMVNNIIQNPPKVTVLMSVYNGEKYLREAIESILNQSYSDFEFLIIDDCSTDSSASILAEYTESDSRIYILKNKKNLGLTKSLNIGLRSARGEYIARMDADDISLPNRLKTQVDFMDKHSDIGVCGSAIQAFQAKESVTSPPKDHKRIVIGLLQDNPVAHPTVLIRTSILKEHEIFYNEDFIAAQDYELWVRLSRVTKFENLTCVLLQYRLHGDNISLKSAGQNDSRFRARLMQYEYILKRRLSDVEVHLVKEEFNVYSDHRLMVKFISEVFKINCKTTLYSNDLLREYFLLLYLRCVMYKYNRWQTLKKALTSRFSLSTKAHLLVLIFKRALNRAST
jgi:glycosyltransferase involved in cell wall biosynthesis